MNKQDLQLLNIEVGTFKRIDNQLTLDMEWKLFRYSCISELNELRHDGPDFLQLTNLIEKDHHIMLTYLLLDRVKNLKALPRGDKARLDTTEDIKIMTHHYAPVFDTSQTSNGPILTTRDFIKDHLTTNHKNVTVLYNEFKNYLNKNTDLKVSEKPLAGLDGAGGYSRKDTNEIVTGDDKSDSQLKLKILYHKFAYSQLHSLNAEYSDHPRPYKETQVEVVAYVAIQNIEVDTGEYSLGYVVIWAKDKEVIYSILSEIQSINKKAIDVTDELTQKLGLQGKQKESDNLKAEAKQEITSENKQPTNNSNRPLSDRV